MHKVIVLLLALSFTGAARAQGVTPPPAKRQSLNVGEKTITMPTPVTDMVEGGDDVRKLMGLFVLPSNRLYAAFVTAQDLSLLAQATDKERAPSLTRYALVQGPLDTENVEVGPAEFALVVEGIKSQFTNANVDATFEKTEQQFSNKLKSMNVDASVDLGKPVNLGEFFSKPDAHGFGVVSTYSINDRSITMAMGSAVVRVKGRLLSITIYTEYKSEKTVAWLRNATEQWAGAVLGLNKIATLR